MLYQLGTGMRAFRALVSAPEPAFTPSSIANLGAWFDSADLATITQSGGAVSQWNDKSGNSLHATQATGANQPATGARMLNGLNVIDFNADRARTLFLPTGAHPLATGNHTVFVVGGCDQTTNSHYLYRARRVSPSSVRNYIGGGSAFRARLGESGSEITDSANTAAHIFIGNRNGSDVDFRIDGALTGSTSGVTDNIIEEYVIGNGFDGFVGEKLVYTRALGSSEINQIGNYLAAKWGITWTNI